MSTLIEGIGDEVTIAVATLVAVSAGLVFAWRSTQVRRPSPPAYSENLDPQNIDQNSEQSHEADIQQDDSSPPSTGPPFRLKLKFLNDTERTVYVTEDWTIGQLKRFHFTEELAGGRYAVRLVFQGRELAETSQKLTEAGLTDLATVHCLISENRNTQNSTSRPQAQPNRHGPGPRIIVDNVSEYDEIGRFLMPVLALLLGCVWYVRIRYRSLFDGFSSLALVAFTMAYLAAVAAQLYRLLGYGANFHGTAAVENSTNLRQNQNSRPAGPPPDYPPPPYSEQNDDNHVHSE